MREDAWLNHRTLPRVMGAKMTFQLGKDGRAPLPGAYPRTTSVHRTVWLRIERIRPLIDQRRQGAITPFSQQRNGGQSMHGARSSEVDLVPDHQIRKKKAPGKLTVLVNGEIEIGLPALGGFTKTMLLVVARLEVVPGIEPDLLTELASKRNPVTPSDDRPRMFQATTETTQSTTSPAHTPVHRSSAGKSCS